MTVFSVRSLDHYGLPLPTDVVGGTIAIDLSRVGFVRPMGLVALASRASLLRSMGHSVAISAPDDSSIANYISRMGLNEICEEIGGIDCQLTPVRANPQASRLLEVTSFRSPADLETLAQQLERHMPEGAVDDVESLLTCVYEVGQNVPQHSQAGIGFAAAQYYPKNREYLFSIGDSGLGLRATLGQSYAPADDAVAIDFAVKPGISSKQDAVRGTGLDTTRGILTTHGGSLEIASGTATKTFRTATGHQPNFRTGRGNPGTLISGALPSSRYA